MRISDWSSDVCSSDLSLRAGQSDTKLAGLMKPTQPTAMPWTPALPEEGLAASAAPARAGSWWHHVATAKPASPTPADHRHRFPQLALDAAALRSGELTLKYGRSSPYLSHAGHLDSGVAPAHRKNDEWGKSVQVSVDT